MSFLGSLLGFIQRQFSSFFGRTVIPDGNDQPLTSDFDGQRFVLNKGDETLVDGEPVLTIDDDRVSFRNSGTAETTGDTATIDVQGDRAYIDNRRHGEILAEDTAIEVSGRDAEIRNKGLIDGGINGVNFANGGESSGRLTNHGTIQSDSRAVNIGGEDISVRNFGDILGTGDQRNGTIYSDATAEDYSILNGSRGRVDAGEGNDGAGIALQTGDHVGDAVRAQVTNFGEIAGRGQAAANVGQAGDGIRVFSGVDGGGTTFRGNIYNAGDVTSESNQGPTAAIRISDGLSFDGKITNARHGLIDGANNGLYFGDAEHDAEAVNFGTIQSGSRAVNIDGTGVELKNYGRILGTDDQRNGTVYSDATADDYSIANYGRIDAGEGNQGAGIALQTGEVVGDVVRAEVVNDGTVEGRGQAAADTGLAGDGIRVFSGVSGGGTTFRGDIYNSGDVTSESLVGPTAGIRIANGVGFDGKITNARHGLIDGANNGLYFGTGEHDAEVVNYGTIQSGSRAVNIDGTGVELKNYGDILGTGDQRNGTVYSDATADDYSIENRGLIDAGEGNQGAGVALQTGEVFGDVVNAEVVNYGTIEGRGQAAADTGLAGDGIRVFSGVAGGGTTFRGDIRNSGRVTSESQVGPTAGIRIANGVAFDGTVLNTRHGLIEGANNGLYFGVAEHDAEVVNRGTIQSDSRAVNIDGSGVDLYNYGDILGTGDQRNGTVYADATAEDFTITNERSGLIDAGEGNDGSGISLQIGDTVGDVVEASVVNDGTVRGRGDGVGDLTGNGIIVSSGIGDSVIFRGDIVNNGLIDVSDDGIDINPGVTVEGDIVNNGRILAVDDGIDFDPDSALVGDIVNSGRIEAGSDGIEIGPVVSITGDIVNRGTIEADTDGVELGFDVVLDGELVNRGTITGDADGDGDGLAIDAVEVEADLTVVNEGTLNGDVVLGFGNDVFDGADGRVNGSIDGGSGNDSLTGGDNADTFVFNLGTGQDTVTNFEDDSDQLDVSAFFDDAADAVAAARQDGADTVIDLDVGAGDSVRLTGIDVNQIDENDFIV